METLQVEFARLYAPEQGAGSGVLVIGLSDRTQREIAFPARHIRVFLALDAARRVESPQPELLRRWSSLRRIARWISNLDDIGYLIDVRTVSVYLSQIRRELRKSIGMPAHHSLTDQILESRRHLGVRITLENWEVIDHGL